MDSCDFMDSHESTAIIQTREEKQFTMKDNVKNLLSCAVVFFVGIWIYVATIGAKSFAAAQIQPQKIPRIVAVALFALGFLLLATTILSWKRDHGSGAKIEVSSKNIGWRGWVEKNTALLTFILIFLYIFLMKKTGFVTITTCYLCLQITILSGALSGRQILRNFFISVVIALIVFFIFNKGFALSLPLNSLGF